MASVKIQEYTDDSGEPIEISSVSVSDAEKFEALRQAFNRLSTDTLAERYPISPSFINDDGSFDEVAREQLLVEEEVNLVKKVSALQSLRNTSDSNTVGDRVNTEFVSVETAREFQKNEAEEVKEQTAQRRSEQAPKLQELDSNGNVILEFVPSVVTNFGGSVPFDTESTQLQDGQTLVDQRGDHNLRMNMEAVATFNEMNKLFVMRKSGNPLRLIWAGQPIPASFDQLNFDRIPDANGRVTAEEPLEDALYTVQLQSKEQDEDDDTLFQPFTQD